MLKKIAVIGVGNMAKAIISGIRKSNLDVSCFYLYDVNPHQYDAFSGKDIVYSPSLEDAVASADCVLLSVKPQNFAEVLYKISLVPFSSEKLYITIVSNTLKTNKVVRVLPNLPMLISKGVSVVCYNNNISEDDFDFVVNVFESAGSVLKIDEVQMNKIIGVTSSSPAYVFKFINAICEGARAQGIGDDGLLDAVCDMIIGSVELIKSGFGTPDALVKSVASKGGTTERALAVLDENGFDDIIVSAMLACTNRADELGKEN